MVECLEDMVHWTPVDIELPSISNIPVLFWVSRTDITGGGYIGWYNKKERKWFDVYGAMVNGVTHWMAFPKGPDCILSVSMELKINE